MANLSDAKKAAADFFARRDGSVPDRMLIKEIHNEKYSHVPIESIRSAVKRAKKAGGLSFHGRCKVEPVFEHALSAFCLSLAAKGTPATDKYILQIARECTQMDLSRKWLSGFVSRWSTGLKRCRSTSMEAERINSLSNDMLENFLKAYDSEQRYILEDGSNLFNADEVPAKYSSNSPVLVWATSHQLKVGCIESKDQQVKTFVPFISASGRLWMLLLIYEVAPGKEENDVFLPAAFENSRKSPFMVFLAATAKGYMTKDLWKAACDQFAQLLYAEFFAKECVLVLDNLSAHVNPQTVAHLAKKGLRCLFLPPHTSHFLQPLDNGPNGAIASEVRTKRAQTHRNATLTGEDPSGTVPTLIVLAARHRLTSRVVSACWEVTGLWPFDEKRIREAAEPYLKEPPKIASTGLAPRIETIARNIYDTAFALASPVPKKRGTVSSARTGVFTVEQTEEAYKKKLSTAEHAAKEKEGKKMETLLRRQERQQEKDRAKAVTLQNQLVTNGRGRPAVISFCIAQGEDCVGSPGKRLCPNLDHGGICRSCWSQMSKDDQQDCKCAECD